MLKGNDEIKVYDFYEAAYYRMQTKQDPNYPLDKEKRIPSLPYYTEIGFGGKVIWMFGSEAKDVQEEYRGEVKVNMSGAVFAEWIKETKKEMHHKKEE